MTQITGRPKKAVKQEKFLGFFVKHTDKEHLHVHIVANRVDNNGGVVGKGLVVERSIKAAQELTREYRLQQEQGKNLQQTHLDALHEPDAKRYRIYQAIQGQLPLCHNLEDLEKGLLAQGITVRYRRDEETGRRQGISFRLENRSFKGSRVDKAFSLKKLEERLSLQQRQAEGLKLEEQRRGLEREQAQKQKEEEQGPRQRHGLRHGW